MKTVILLYTLCFIQSLFAFDFFYDENNIPERHQEMSPKSKYAYSFVMKYCKNWSMAFSEIEKSGMKEMTSIIGGLNLRALQVRKKHKGNGVHLEVILNSPGYLTGLNDCFGNNRSSKDLFTINLLSADSLGTVSGMSAGILTWVVGGQLFKFVGKNVLKLSPVVRKKIKKGVFIATWTAGGGFILINILEQIHEKMKIAESIKISNEERLKKIDEVKEDLDFLLLHSEDPSLSEKELVFIEEYIIKLTIRINRIEEQIELSIID